MSSCPACCPPTRAFRVSSVWRGEREREWLTGASTNDFLLRAEEMERNSRNEMKEEQERAFQEAQLRDQEREVMIKEQEEEMKLQEEIAEAKRRSEQEAK